MADNEDFIEIEMPDGAVLEFPSSMSQDDINQAAQKYHQQSPVEQKKPKPEQSLQQKIARYGIQNPLVGAGKMGRNMAGLYQNIPIVKKLTSDEQMSKAMGLPPPSEQGAGDIASQAIPDVAGAMLTPGAQLPNYMTKLLSKAPGIAGKVMPKVASEGISQGLYGSAVSPPGQKTQGGLMSAALSAPFAGLSKAAEVTPSAVTRQATSAGLGGLGGLMGYEMGEQAGMPGWASGGLGALLGASAYRGAARPEYQMKKQLEGVTPEKAAENLAKADRLKINITPAEAIESPGLGRTHAKAAKSKAGSEEYYQQLKNRNLQEQGSIERLMNLIYNEEKHKPLKDAAYETSKMDQVDPMFIMEYTNNPIIQEAISKIEKDPELMRMMDNLPKETKQISGVGSTSTGKPSKEYVGYWDTVKKYLDKKIERLEQGKGSSVDKMKEGSLKSLRKEMVNKLDNYSDDYKVARGLSEREKARETINKAFNKVDVKTGHELYKTIKNNDKFEDLLFHLRNEPEAVQMLQDMKSLFNEARQMPKISTSAGLEGTGMLESRNLGNFFKQLLNKITQNGEIDKEAINMVYSGKWQQMMDELNQVTDRQMKMAKATDLLGDMFGVTGRQATTEEQ